MAETRPFALPLSHEGRIAALEKFETHQLSTNRQQVEELRGIREEIAGLTAAITTISAQREREAKSSDRLKHAGLALLGGIALALMGWIAKIAMIVQTAKAVSGN